MSVVHRSSEPVVFSSIKHLSTAPPRGHRPRTRRHQPPSRGMAGNMHHPDHTPTPDQRRTGTLLSHYLSERKAPPTIHHNKPSHPPHKETHMAISKRTTTTGKTRWVARYRDQNRPRVRLLPRRIRRRLITQRTRRTTEAHPMSQIVLTYTTPTLLISFCKGSKKNLTT